MSEVKMTTAEVLEQMQEIADLLRRIGAPASATDLDEARAAVAALVADLDRTRELLGDARIGLSALETVRETLKRECEALKAERDELSRALSASIKTLRSVSAERDALRSAGNRVTAAFRAMGESRSMYGTLTTLRRECEDAMAALDAALAGDGHVE